MTSRRAVSRTRSERSGGFGTSIRRKITYLNSQFRSPTKGRGFESSPSVPQAGVWLLPVKTASGVRTADLADALVVNKAKITAQQRSEPYRGTYTFDQAALALAGTKAL